MLLIGEAIRKKISLSKIHKLSKIDPWFLGQIKEIIDIEIKIKKNGIPKSFEEFNFIKSIGFSDKKLSELTKKPEKIIRNQRIALKILPVYIKKLILALQNLNLYAIYVFLISKKFWN